MKQPLQTKTLFAALMLFLVTLGASAQLNISVTAINAQCPGQGGLTINVTAGLDPLGTITYAIYDGQTATGVARVVTGGSPFTYSPLSAGYYTVVATQNVPGLPPLPSLPFVVQILDQAAEPAYNPVITGVHCVNDGSVRIDTVLGIAQSFQLIAGTGNVSMPAQASNTFTGLGVGTYSVRVVDVCGRVRNIDITISQESTFLNVSPYFYPPGTPFPIWNLPSCTEIRTGHTINTTGAEVIFYPLTLTYTVTAPDGTVSVRTQTVTMTPPNTPQRLDLITMPIPFYYDQSYSYILTVTDACGNQFSSPPNVVNEHMTVDAQADYGHCDESIILDVHTFVPPFRVEFTSPGGFNATAGTHNPDHNLTNPTHTTTTVTYNNHVPDGTYNILITDSCGRTATTSVVVDTPPQDLVLSGTIACGTPPIGSLHGEWQRAPTNFDQIRFVQPIPPAYTGPTDLMQFIDDPNNPISFTVPNLPPGTYTVEAVNECGTRIWTKVETLVPVVQHITVQTITRTGCDEGYGSINLVSTPAGSDPILGVRILRGPAVWEALNAGIPRPIDVSNNLVTATGNFYMNSLPEGDYVMEILDTCGWVEWNIHVNGFHTTVNDATVDMGCNSYDITLRYSGPSLATTVVSWWLQKRLPSGGWGSPDGTGVEYPAPVAPSTTPPVPTPASIAPAPPNPLANAYRLPSPGTTGEATITLGFLGEEFRIIEVYTIFGNGLIQERCVIELENFRYNGAPVLEEPVSIPTSPTTATVYASASGVAPFQYRITAPVAIPADGSYQSSGEFPGLDIGTAYTFEVIDRCLDTDNRPYTPSNVPLAITQSAVCEGQTVTLSVPPYPFLSYIWTRVSDGVVVSTTNEYVIPSYDSATDASQYTVTATITANPAAIVPPIAPVTLLPIAPISAGTPALQAAICSGTVTQPLNLLDYLTGEDAGGTFTQSATTPGGLLTGSDFNISTITASGTFDFTYTVQNVCGDVDTSQITVTVTESPAAPTVSALSVQCEGTPFNLTAASTTPLVTYEWTRPDATTFTGAVLPFAGAIAETGTYSVVAVSADGNCRSVATNVTVTVTAAPNAGVGQTRNICNTATGTIEQLETSTYINGTFDLNGDWFDISATPVPPTQFNAATGTFDTAGLFGQYQFRYEVTACGTTVSTIVTVNLNATPATPVVSAVATTVCVSQNIDLIGPAVANATYSWTGPNNFVSSLQSPQIIAATAQADGVYSLVVTVNNCPSVAGTVTVNVVPLPYAGLSTSTTLCTDTVANSETLASRLGTADVGGTWTLVSADTPLTTEFDAIAGTFQTAGLTGRYVFNYAVTSACGLTDNEDVVYILNARPNQPVATAASTTVCEIDGSINFTTPLVTGASYQWFKNGTAITGATTDTYTINSATTADAADYTVTVTVFGCTSVPSAPVTIIVTLKPQYTLTGNTILCPGQPTTISVVPTSNTFGLTDANITYTWYVDGVLDATLTTGTLTNVTTTDDVTYTVDVTNTNGGCATRVTRDLTIDRDPFTVVLQSDCIDEHLVLSITNISDIGTTQSVNWTGPGVSQNGNVATLDVTVANGAKGEYTVEVTNSNGCVKTQVIDIQSLHCIIPKGISPDTVDEKNDFFDLTNLKVENLQIFNRYGLQVYEKNNYTKEWFGQSDKGDLPTGTYFYVAKMPGKQVTGWVYIQRTSN